MKEKNTRNEWRTRDFFEQNTDARDMVMKFLELSELDVDFVPKNIFCESRHQLRTFSGFVSLFIFVTIKILFFDFQEKV